MIGPADFGPLPPVWRTPHRPGDELFTYALTSPQWEGTTPSDSPSFTRSPIGDWSLADAGLEPVVQELWTVAPVEASVLDAAYRRLRRCQRTAQAVEAHGWARVAERNGEAERVNTELDCHLSILRETRSSREAEGELELLAIDDRLFAAHIAGNRAAARARGDYDPAAPSLACLPEACLRSPLAIAADLRVPDASEDEGLVLPPDVHLAASLITGAALGIGVFSMSGALPLDRLATRPPWALLILAVAVGYGITTFSAALVKGLFAFASQRVFRTGNAGPGIGASVVAIGVLLLLVAIDAVVEQEGLLRPSQLNAALASLNGESHASHVNLAMVCASLILTVPYLGYAAFTGVLRGKAAAAGHIERQREAERLAAREALLSDPARIEAAEALGMVRILLTRRTEVRESLASDLAATDRQIAALEARKRPILDELDPQDQRRLQQALDDLARNQAAFDQLLEEARHLARGRQYGGRGLGFWKRLWKGLGCLLRSLVRSLSRRAIPVEGQP